MLQSATECYRVLQSITECYSVLQSVTECYRVLLSVSECCRVLQSVTAYYRVLQIITEYFRLIQSITDYYKVFLVHLRGPIFGLVFLGIIPKPKFHIKFRNTDPPPPYLGIIPKNNSFLLLP